MNISKSLAGSICAIAFLILSLDLYGQYSYTTISVPASRATWIYGSSGNDLVGAFEDRTGIHGFLYDGFTFTTLNDPLADPGSGTRAYGISGKNVVGVYYDNTGCAHGFIYNGVSYTALTYPPGVPTYAYGISGNLIVGAIQTVGSWNRGLMYSDGTFTVLNYPSSPCNTYLTGVDGDNVIGYDLSNGINNFLYDGNSLTPLTGLPPGGVARGIYGSTIVGEYGDLAGTHGFAYNGATYTTLNDPLSAASTFATAVSGNSIVGYYHDSSGAVFGFIATPIPEPSTLPLLILLGIQPFLRRVGWVNLLKSR